MSLSHGLPIAGHLYYVSRILLEKLIFTKLVKKFPAIYEPQRFITAIETAHY